MNRTIKFRGLRTDGKGWAVGYLAYFFDLPQNSMIMPSCYYGTRDFGDEDENGNPKIEDELALGGFTNVNPETVGQFTGHSDCNGIELFEGDTFHMGDPNITHTVIWRDTGFMGKQNGSSSYVGIEHWIERITITGNIHQPK